MTEKNIIDADTCATCKYVGTYKRPRVTGETGFGDQIEFADDDEIVFMCKAPSGPHAGHEIGTKPTVCESWATAVKTKSARLEELDRMIAAQNERAAKRERE